LKQARHDYKLDNLATKRDLKELELTLTVKIAETKADLIRWVVGAESVTNDDYRRFIP
jgi:hypothetical protein